MKKILKKFMILVVLCWSIVITGGCAAKKSSVSEKAQTAAITISAGASLKDAMGEIQNEYTKENPNVTLTVNFGSSGTLQQQIEQGAPVDVFISAGEKQMKALSDKSLLMDGTEKDLLTNHMVLVAPLDSKITGFDDLKTDAVKKIAIGETKTVPAGQYAAQVLDYYKLTGAVKDKLVYGQDVKTVLSWVETGNADVGMVYKTDALKSSKVNVIVDAPEDSHTPITYPVAVIKDTKNADAANAFEDFLFTDTAQKIFQKYGFEKAK